MLLNVETKERRDIDEDCVCRHVLIYILTNSRVVGDRRYEVQRGWGWPSDIIPWHTSPSLTDMYVHSHKLE
jgi:hypothetical protein